MYNAGVICMKLTLAQLRKLQMPYRYSEELDLKDDLVDFEDIIDTSLVHVDYEIRERGIDTYLVEFKYEVTLTMQCSITLNEVDYVISEEGSEIFSTTDEVEDVFLIEGQTLDTKEAILTNVICGYYYFGSPFSNFRLQN